MSERLQKIIARAGITSRRKAEELIVSGRVTVDGAVVRELGSQADLESQTVCVDGKAVRGADKLRYLALHKPKGCVTTTDDPEGRPTVMDLLGREASRGLFPVGRLDFNTEGLLLLTNDGDFANRILTAKNRVPKVYEVKVNRRPSDAAFAKLRAGIRLDGRLARPEAIRLLRNADSPWFEITLVEGRNRQIHRMFERVGILVEKIRRVSIGRLSLRRLEPRQVRELEPREVQQLLNPPPAAREREEEAGTDGAQYGPRGQNARTGYRRPSPARQSRRRDQRSGPRREPDRRSARDNDSSDRSNRASPRKRTDQRPREVRQLLNPPPAAREREEEAGTDGAQYGPRGQNARTGYRRPSPARQSRRRDQRSGPRREPDRRSARDNDSSDRSNRASPRKRTDQRPREVRQLLNPPPAAREREEEAGADGAQYGPRGQNARTGYRRPSPVRQSRRRDQRSGPRREPDRRSARDNDSSDRSNRASPRKRTDQRADRPQRRGRPSTTDARRTDGKPIRRFKRSDKPQRPLGQRRATASRSPSRARTTGRGASPRRSPAPSRGQRNSRPGSKARP